MLSKIINITKICDIKLIIKKIKKMKNYQIILFHFI